MKNNSNENDIYNPYYYQKERPPTSHKQIKDQINEDIINNNLLINNDIYTKNFVDININLANSKNTNNKKSKGCVKTKYKTPSKPPLAPSFTKDTNMNNKQKENSQTNIKSTKNMIPTNKKTNKSNNNIPKKKNNNNDQILKDLDDEPFNVNISKINIGGKSMSNPPKDRIKILTNKLENIYNEALEKSEKIKTNNLPFNINCNPNNMINIIIEEIKFLKIKNELLKLKSNFQETIFYSIKELIEETKFEVSGNKELSEYISNFHNKILCILTQNNQKFYENLKFIDNKNEEVLFAFNLKDDDITEKINQKNISTLTNIEENIQKIIKDVDNILSFNDLNLNENSDLKMKINTLKLRLILGSNNIISYYLLSDNFNFQFNNKNKFLIFSPEDIANNQLNQRKNKIKNNWGKLIKPLIHKALTPKNEKDLMNFILDLSLFYENLNKNINIQNNIMKINGDELNKKSGFIIQKLKTIIDNYIKSNVDGFSKLNELFNFIDENQSKNADKVIFSLINTEKQNYLNLIYNFNLLKDTIENLGFS